MAIISDEAKRAFLVKWHNSGAAALSDNGLSPEGRLIKAMLAQEKGAKFKACEIAERLKHPRKIVSYHLKYLIEKGQIESEERVVDKKHASRIRAYDEGTPTKIETYYFVKPLSFRDLLDAMEEAFNPHYNSLVKK